MIRLTDQAFDPGVLLADFCRGRREDGAVASFTGLARAEQGETGMLELEAYPGFTEARIGVFCGAARERFGVSGIHVTHRVGKIAPGEAIVFVAAAARRRREAFQACDYLMDYLKSRAPFWKKEHGPNGERWIEPRGEDHADLARWEEKERRR